MGINGSIRLEDPTAVWFDVTRADSYLPSLNFQMIWNNTNGIIRVAVITSVPGI